MYKQWFTRSELLKNVTLLLPEFSVEHSLNASDQNPRKVEIIYFIDVKGLIYARGIFLSYKMLN